MIGFERLEPRVLLDATVPGPGVTPDTLPPDFAPEGSTAIIGDWNGDGVADAGAFLETGRNRGSFLLDLNADGMLQPEERFDVRGVPNPQVSVTPGDWNADGDDDAGLYIPASRRRGVLQDL